MPVVVKAPTDEVPNVEEVKRAAAKVGRAFGNRDKYNRAHAQLVAVLEKQDPAHLRFWAQVPILDMRWSGATGQGGYWAVATQAVNDVSADLMRQRGREWREKHGSDFVIVQETPPARTEQQTTLGNDFATNRNPGFNLESKDFGDEPDALVDVRPPPDPRQTALPAVPTAPSAAPLELVKDSAELMLDIQAEYAIQDIEAAAERQLSGQDDRFEKLRQGIVTPKPEPVTVVPVPPVAEHSPEVTVRPARVAPEPAVAVVVVAEPAPRAEPPVAVVAVTDSAPRPPKLKAPPKKRAESFRGRTIRQAAESALGGRRRKRQRRHPFLNRSEQ